jgi:hypothetical protein
MNSITELLARIERRRQLVAAAEALLPDYTAGGELTIFTALDSEEPYIRQVYCISLRNNTERRKGGRGYARQETNICSRRGRKKKD